MIAATMLAIPVIPDTAAKLTAPDLLFAPALPLGFAALLPPEAFVVAPGAAAVGAAVGETVGNAVYIAVLWNVTQLDEAGSLGVYGMVAMGPRDSAGWV